MDPYCSIVIPAYNEAGRLPATLAAIAHYCGSRTERFEAIIVDDGSRDGTASIPTPPSLPDLQWRRLRNPSNRGKGFSVRRGMLAATGDLRLFTDADLSAPMDELPKLEAALARGADLAFGSRSQRDLLGQRQNRLRESAGRMFNRLVRRALDLPFADTQCGFKLFTRACALAVFRRQTIEGWGFDPELLTIARQEGFALEEVPVAWAHAPGAKIRVVRDSVRMFADVIAIRRAHPGGATSGRGLGRAA